MTEFLHAEINFFRKVILYFVALCKQSFTNFEHYLDSSSFSSSRDLLRSFGSEDPDPDLSGFSDFSVLLKTISRIPSKSRTLFRILVRKSRAPSSDKSSNFNPRAALSNASLRRCTSHFSTASLTSLMAAGCPKLILQTSVRKDQL